MIRFFHPAALCIALFLVGSAVVGATGGEDRKLYKWVDQQGVIHYGDNVPQEYQGQERHIFNRQGVEIDRVEGQKSPEQMAADEQKRLTIEQNSNRDRNLLTTYASVQEIERLRDQRIALLADQIKVTTQFLEILNGRLTKFSKSAMQYKPYSDDPKAQRMPDQLAEDLARVGGDIRTQEQNLRQKRSESATLSVQFASDISRFKELKGNN